MKNTLQKTKELSVTRLAADRTKSSPTIRKSINWWNTLTYPQRYEHTKLCYPEQKSVFVTDKQKDEMYNLLNN